MFSLGGFKLAGGGHGGWGLGRVAVGAVETAVEGAVD